MVRLPWPARHPGWLSRARLVPLPSPPPSTQGVGMVVWHREAVLCLVLLSARLNWRRPCSVEDLVCPCPRTHPPHVWDSRSRSLSSRLVCAGVSGMEGHRGAAWAGTEELSGLALTRSPMSPLALHTPLRESGTCCVV